jgi:ferrochelatase
MKKIAVVLLNLGGPDNLDGVEKFLFNLFNDKAIISLPNPFRWMIAKIISSTRSGKTKNIYSNIGGGSPLLKLTKQQAVALENSLKSIQKKQEFKVFVSMRYWHPFSLETIAEIKKFGADEILLLPLYPQFSTTTTESSIKDFKKSLGGVPVKSVCCYFNEDSFISAHLEKIKTLYKKIKSKHKKIKILFSAHGLPKSVIDKGDPYQWQIEQTVELIMKGLDAEYKVCYQSKVGPMKWLEPNTESEIEKAAEEGFAVMIVPIAFVSEHSETLYELDIQYKELADKIGLKGYYRVGALAIDKLFIEALTNLILKLAKIKHAEKDVFVSGKLNRVCPKQFCGCINNYKERKNA